MYAIRSYYEKLKYLNLNNNNITSYDALLDLPLLRNNFV